MRVQAMEEAKLKARKKAELDRWAETEANRLAAIGVRERAAEREADLREARFEADRKREEKERKEKIALQDRAASPAPAVTPTGRALLPPLPTAPPHKRPPAKLSMDEVREQVSAQIRKALPAIAAAQSSREKSRRENGNSSG
jgi:hypothetical protein